jgi:hypothetical protein
MKLLIVLTTYKRNEKVLRFLDSFNNSKYLLIKNYIDIIVADDNPNSNLGSILDSNIKDHIFNIIYKKNDRNLGQGKNAAFTIYANYNYDYYWMPGDDDIIIVEEFIDIIQKIVIFKPDVALLEFRQGLHMDAGTFFEGESRVINNFQECISNIIKFGKNTSTIFKRPSEWAINETITAFSESMYQDKVLAIFSFLESNDKKVYLKTEITAMGDIDYGKLRYSMRVFVNLDLSLKLAIKKINDKYNTFYTIFDDNLKSPFWWWKYGLSAHFNSKSQLSYTKHRLLFEILYPFTYIFRKIFNKNQYFEIN